MSDQWKSRELTLNTILGESTIAVLMKDIGSHTVFKSGEETRARRTQAIRFLELCVKHSTSCTIQELKYILSVFKE